MKIKLKIASLSALAAGAFVGLSMYGNSIDESYTIPSACYQGYYNAEGKTMLVFDPHPLIQRKGRAEHIIEGNFDKLPEMEMGLEYDVTVGKPKFSRFFPERITDAKEVKKNFRVSLEE